jgi:hypothetical protein
MEQVSRYMADALVERLGDEVDLVFEYGSRLTGRTHRFSDLDISWTPAHGDTWSSITVLVGGTLFDLYPMHWSTLEEMADYRSISSSVLLANRILYARDEAAVARFHALSERLRGLLEPGSRPLALRGAQSVFERTSQPYLLLRASAADGHVLGCIQQSRSIVAGLFHCVAIANQRCVDTRKVEQVLDLPELPEGFAEAARLAIRSRRPDELVAACEQLLFGTRRFLVEQGLRAARPGATYAEACRALYPEAKADLDRIVLAAERGDMLLAKTTVTSMLVELTMRITQVETGMEVTGLHVAGDYERDLTALGFPALLPPLESGDLAELGVRAVAFDRRLRQFLSEHGVALNEFANLAALRAAVEGGRA